MKKINTTINNEKKAINQYLFELVPKSCRPYVEKAVEDLNKLNKALIKEIETLREEANAHDEALKIIAKKTERLENNNCSE